MLDIRYIRENPDNVQAAATAKGYSVSISELLKLDDDRRELQQKVDSLREKRNAVAAQMKGGKPTPELIEQGKALKDELGGLEAQFNELDATYQSALNAIPNITMSDVPPGGEEDSVEIKKVGEQKTGAIDHLDFALKRDWVDFERGAKVAGAKFYFLKNELALLEQAMIQYGINFIREKGDRKSVV